MYLSKNKERQIIKLYPNTEDLDIAKIVGVSEWMVRKVATDNELEKDNDGEWNKDEIGYLIKNYSNCSNAVISQVLGRDKAEVEHQAIRLGLQKNKEYFGNILFNDTERNLVKSWSKSYDSNIHGTSKGNYLLGLILDYLYPNYTKRTEEPIGGLRIDLYIKELKIGFEFDGVQHLEYNSFFYDTKQDFINAQNRDYSKSYMCEKQGIAIVKIYHNEDLSIALVRAKIDEVL